MTVKGIYKFNKDYQVIFVPNKNGDIEMEFDDMFVYYVLRLFRIEILIGK